ncbi:Omp28-related outer membrane protein [Taibaiella lutea]|uniref:Omp28-related outer membrane protein n=1 Tax=Taibaiella lutea TaxID=2608001 RepID=A0A5M6CMQ6_9BACT|nr:Omp28-related outer membrane protein [Taibaiella lutea]KAA5536414.1 Omp28-related outer membrane protein [Taibaiella lutea]
MKKLLLAALCVSASATLFAQVPDMKSRSVVFKFTETWCGPCGEWGWELAEDIIGDLGDKGYYIGVMGSSTPATMDANCYDAFESNFPITGYPTFMVNNTDGGFILSSVQNVYNPVYTTAPVVSPAGVYTIANNKITLNTKTKFWSNTTGDYYVAAYVVEDSVLATQNGQTGMVGHHHILRGSMNTDLSPWGQNLVNGSVNANAEYTKAFTMDIAQGWVANKLEVYVIIYKKEGTTYKVVNAKKASLPTTGIAEISGLKGVKLFPNPAGRNGANISFDLAKASYLSINVTDMSGRVVQTIKGKDYATGVNNVFIPTSMLMSGAYSINIYGNEGVQHEALIINN